jgi:hypothetical protein
MRLVIRLWETCFEILRVPPWVGKSWLDRVQATTIGEKRWCILYSRSAIVDWSCTRHGHSANWRDAQASVMVERCPIPEHTHAPSWGAFVLTDSHVVEKPPLHRCCGYRATTNKNEVLRRMTRGERKENKGRRVVECPRLAPWKLLGA